MRYVSNRVSPGSLCIGLLGSDHPLFVEGRAPEPVLQTDMTDPARFNRDVFQWSLEMDIQYGAGAWWRIYGQLAS